MENSKKKPEPEQCLKGLCKAIEKYCDSVKCPSLKKLDDVTAILMFFFRENRKLRIHTIGEISMEDFGEACMNTLNEMSKEQFKRVDYAA
jgi:hypothetical protein